MGTKFSMKDPNPGIWFKFDEEDPNSGEIAIRTLNVAKRHEIRKKTVKKRVEYKHGQRFEVEDQNEDLFSELLWDYILADWHGLEEEDTGKPIECTTENKVFLMQNNVGFAAFVNQCMEIVNEGIEDRTKAAVGNLQSGQSAEEQSRPVTAAKPSKAKGGTNETA